jgi:alginate O-acetyltransferase complex protein AlgI
MPLIVAGGLGFYAWWDVRLVWVPIVLTLMGWGSVLLLERCTTDRQRKQVLAAAVTALLLPLALFKYTNFVYRDVIGLVIPVGDRLVDWSLPLGISFITFTMLAYVVDVYRRRYPPERSALNLAGYVVFFPHMIAGPVLRPSELLPQLTKSRPARTARFMLGMFIFAMGMLKKVVFADAIAPFVERVYKGQSDGTALDYLLAMYGFAMQIYCDFSGYTDMAIGIAIALHVRLPTNFKRPYVSDSIVDFWRRWHITLSTWLRDYLYIPLGGNRGGLWLGVRNVMITMGLGGLWHGASWNFAIWGLLHGGWIAIAHLMRAGKLPRPSLPHWANVLITFHLVTVAWVFFRARDLDTALRVLSGPFTSQLGDVPAFASVHAYPIALLLAFFATHRFDHHARMRLFVRRAPSPVTGALIVAVVLLAITLGSGSSAEFIYFDF